MFFLMCYVIILHGRWDIEPEFSQNHFEKLQFESFFLSQSPSFEEKKVRAPAGV